MWPPEPQQSWATFTGFERAARLKLDRLDTATALANLAVLLFAFLAHHQRDEKAPLLITLSP